MVPNFTCQELNLRSDVCTAAAGEDGKLPSGNKRSL